MFIKVSSVVKVEGDKGVSNKDCFIFIDKIVSIQESNLTQCVVVTQGGNSITVNDSAETFLKKIEKVLNKSKK